MLGLRVGNFTQLHLHEPGTLGLGMCAIPSPPPFQEQGWYSDPIRKEEEGGLGAEKGGPRRPLGESVWTLVRVPELRLRPCSSASMLCNLGQVFHSLVGAWWLLVTSKVISSSEGAEFVLELNFRPILTPGTVEFLSRIPGPLCQFLGLG